VKHGRFGTYAYCGLVAAVLLLTLLRGWWRIAVLIPTLYLAALVWETIMVEQTAVARYILFGALLVALMQWRPQGLLGTPRVEIV
jgi:ABC-type branched-subunit amino acid transport system permease subunit